MRNVLPAACLVVLVLTVGGISAAAERARKTEGSLKPFLGKPVLHKRRLFERGRFPNVVVALDGTVVATWGRESLRVRRSENGGAAWGPVIKVGNGLQGGGATVDETSGDILVFVHPEHPPRDGSTAPRTMYRSTDHGESWKTAAAVFHKDARGHVPSLHMSEHGITLRHGEHAGRLIRPARVFNRPKGYNTAIYSDDGGKTWHPSRPFPEQGTGEGTVAELSDGSLYYNSRVHWPEAEQPKRRHSARSTDDGETWKDRRIVDILPDGRQDRAYGCMGGLVRLPVRGKDILLFSNLDTPRSRRERVTVWASFDGGRTWPVKRLVHDGPSRYSSLAAGRPGTPSAGWIFLQFEEGRNGGGAQLARFNLSWVLQGKPTGDGKLPKWLP